MPSNFSTSSYKSYAKNRNNVTKPGVYKYFDLGKSAETAAASAKAIKDATGTNTDGNYWIKFPDGNAYEVYCIMSTGGGGWMNLNTTFGQYTGAIFNSSSGAGSRDMIGSVTGTATQTFIGPYVTHNQAAECGNCSGSNCPSRISVNSSIRSAMGITEYRMKGYVSSPPNWGSCPYFAIPNVSVNLAGTLYTGCAINANLGPSIDVYGPATSDYIVLAWSVCNGSSPWTGRVEGLYVR